ncbi:MAG: hypothetical protein NTX73_03190 [Rhodobacterales bacterium]|nr:hypothetical protein [Rhodobacterales bacterium]
MVLLPLALARKACNSNLRQTRPPHNKDGKEHERRHLSTGIILTALTGLLHLCVCDL